MLVHGHEGILMAKAKLVSLRLRGFRSFVDDTTIEFPEAGLVMLKGVSGSGKSSINLAIAYALGYSQYPATELASWAWLEPQAMLVQLTMCDEKGRTAVISRGESSYFEIDGKKTKGAGAIETELKAFLGMDSERLQATTYRPQKSPGFFLTQPNSKKQDFLIPLLGLSDVDSTIKVSQEAIKKLLILLPGLEEHQRSSEAKAKEALDRYSGLQAPIDVTDLEMKAHHLSTEEILVKEGLAYLDEQTKFMLSNASSPKLKEAKANLEMCQKLLEEARKDYQQQVAVYNEFKEGLWRKQKALSLDERKSSDAEKRLFQVEKEMASMGDDNCPTCLRPWEQSGDLKLSLQEERNSLMETVASYNKVHEQIKEVNRLLNVSRSPEQNPILEKLKRAEEKIKLQIAEETTAVEASLDLQQDKAMALKAKLFSIQDEAAKISKTIFEHHARHRELELAEFLVKEATDRQKVDTDKCQQSRSTMNQEQDFVELMGRDGFLGKIFDEVLDEISIETNEILSSISNTEALSIRFRSESLTQKGTVEKGIVAVVSIQGNEIPLKSGLSGGMMSATDLAVDLAIGFVVSRRVGSFPSWLVLDESFEGLDPVPKESCMEILRKYSNDKLILVVDHANEFQGLFDKVISFDFKDGRTTISLDV